MSEDEKVEEKSLLPAPELVVKPEEQADPQGLNAIAASVLSGLGELLPGDGPLHRAYELVDTPEERKELVDKVIRAFSLVHSVVLLSPAGRYRSLALTALEEAHLWAKRAVIRD